MIINGKLVSSEIKNKVSEGVIQIEKEFGYKPKLAVVLVGSDPASEIYVSNKHKTCLSLGIESDVLRFDESISEEELIKVVDGLANDDKTNGILIQLPLPKKFNEKNVLSHIPWYKDVDGLTEHNILKMYQNEDGIFPCTPMGVIDLLKYYNIEIEGKRVAIIGRSMLVGKPLSLLLTNLNATVTLCHSRTRNLEEITKAADIIVVAIGKAKFLTQNYVNKNIAIIDVGINRTPEGKVVGDVDFDNVENEVEYITKVPGGCGPMTIAELMKNTIKCFNIQHKR